MHFFHIQISNIPYVGVLLSSTWSDQNGKTKFEAATTKYSVASGAELANGRGNIRSEWSKSIGNVYVATERTAVHSRLSDNCIAFDDGRLYGQSAKIHR